ncbi:MAG: 4-(cytidine 5'-diphospho)-2-C-methyl-D-erythritol kinase [Candidatus Omnitrophota bacterium]
MIVHSYAKLNLYLKVLGKRKDNYHDLKTIFERISLSDKLIFKKLPGKEIKISSNLRSLPKDSSNLAYKAASMLQQVYRVSAGAEIRILKRIPVGSGMGGGSSNAAATLLGLNKLWDINAARSKLINLAEKIGSDVAFFVYETPFALGEGRGERIKPIKLLEKRKFRHIIIVPRINVSTPFIYRQWDRRFFGKNASSAALTIGKNNVKLLTSALKKNDLCRAGQSLFNSLEEVAVSVYPDIGKIKEKLTRLGVPAVLMSGSGPTVFCLIASRKEERKILRELDKNRALQVFVANTH